MFKKIVLISLMCLSSSSYLKSLGLSGHDGDKLRPAEIKLLDSSSKYNDPDYSLQWYFQEENIEKAIDVANENRKIKIAVLDSGIAKDTPDLQYAINTYESKSFLTGYSPYASTSGSDETKNARIHGTFVAGVIGAKRNNKIGITGILNNVELISIRIFDDYGNFDSDLKYLADAIDYCDDIGVDIINLSGGYYNYNADVYNSIKNFSGLFVCSAGNDGLDIDKNNYYPSCYNLDNIISVGGVGTNNTLMHEGLDTNYGKENVDIFAAGDQVHSVGFGQYDIYGGTGTSYATAIITGVAGLYMSSHNTTDYKETKKAILDSVTKKSFLNNLCTTGGELNALNAVHTHSYDYSYDRIDYKYHYGICNCGEKQKSGHVVAGSIEPGGRGICILCGGEAEMGFVIKPLPNRDYTFNLEKDGLYYISETCLINEVLYLSHKDYLKFIETGGLLYE